MIIQTVYIPESKKERKVLQMLNIQMRDAGMDVDFNDVNLGSDSDGGCRLTVSESRRSRKSNHKHDICCEKFAAGGVHHDDACPKFQ